ncbi:hypothetical protein PENTCL1PPCAC_19234, partial [Pristionchus entomophagus]
GRSACHRKERRQEEDTESWMMESRRRSEEEQMETEMYQHLEILSHVALAAANREMRLLRERFAALGPPKSKTEAAMRGVNMALCMSMPVILENTVDPELNIRITPESMDAKYRLHRMTLAFEQKDHTLDSIEDEVRAAARKLLEIFQVCGVSSAKYSSILKAMERRIEEIKIEKDQEKEMKKEDQENMSASTTTNDDFGVERVPSQEPLRCYIPTEKDYQMISAYTTTNDDFGEERVPPQEPLMCYCHSRMAQLFHFHGRSSK